MYCNDLGKTNTASIARQVYDTFEILKQRSIKDDCDVYKEAEIRAESILLSLSQLQNPNLREAIILQMIAENYNIYILLLEKGNKAIEQKWQAIKNQFDLILKSSINIENAPSVNGLKIPTRSDLLTAKLHDYGFAELPKVKALSTFGREKLIQLICEKGLPYAIAMFSFLGFIEYLIKQHFKSQTKVEKEISRWFHSDKEGRNIRGNINVLKLMSKEDKSKFTSHLHKQTVEKDYQNLK